MTTITTGARLHIGFQNLSLARQRLYGGIGLMIDEPRVTVSATPAEGIHCNHDRGETYARRAVEHLEVPGAALTVHESLPAHHGLGSGTQLALAVYTAIGQAYDKDPNPRAAAPALGRGGRSGVGVGVFEHGGIIVDAGHPTSMFTGEPSEQGSWTVPPVIANHVAPEDWRILLIVPDLQAGQSGIDEHRSIQTIIEQADPTIADQISKILTHQFLPGLATGDPGLTGTAISQIGQLNGAWYAQEQGGVYRPAIASIISELGDCDRVAGIGQSSWGPTVFGLTTADGAAAARQAAVSILAEQNIDGECYITSIDNRGAVRETDASDYS